MRRAIPVAAVSAVLASRLIPLDRDNPPVVREVNAPPRVHAILECSEYDCYSNQTRWPWYARVVPIAWRVASETLSGPILIEVARRAEAVAPLRP